MLPLFLRSDRPQALGVVNACHEPSCVPAGLGAAAGSADDFTDCRRADQMFISQYFLSESTYIPVPLRDAYCTVTSDWLVFKSVSKHQSVSSRKDRETMR